MTEGTRHPVALLQLSAVDGYCALFRLCCIRSVPLSLRELLENDNVIKVGVGPQSDAEKLSFDYGVGVASTLDLRYVACLAGHHPGGLANLAKTHLNAILNKHWRIVCSNWEAQQLSDKQIEYAANDAVVAIEILKKLCDDIKPRKFWQLRHDFLKLNETINTFLDVGFKESLVSSFNITKGAKVGLRSLMPYENCSLEAPDGSLLAAIDRRKANWYVGKDLATLISVDPLRVRLKFEPAGRPVGVVGLYNQIPKENQCVVCGQRDAYIRKNIVPREYRKYFPVLIKSHISHDVLLMCPRCHQLSNISDLKVRKKLAKLCDAPISQGSKNSKSIEEKEFNKLRSAAKALLKHSDKIPPAKKDEMENLLKQHYNVEIIDQQLLEEIVNMDTSTNTEEGESPLSHGALVVDKFQKELGGLIELERIWREHFLNTMKPKFLPPFWNINFTADNLKIRAEEGRVDEDTLKAAGVSTL